MDFFVRIFKVAASSTQTSAYQRMLAKERLRQYSTGKEARLLKDAVEKVRKDVDLHKKRKQEAAKVERERGRAILCRS